MSEKIKLSIGLEVPVDARQEVKLNSITNRVGGVTHDESMLSHAIIQVKRELNVCNLTKKTLKLYPNKILHTSPSL
jgi:hypothetical protein